MSDSASYNKKYEHNEAFVEYVKNNSEFSDWEIIGTFYAALHFMNLYLNLRYHTNIDDISSHKKRNEYISDNCSKCIALAYKTLYDLSREARYQYTDVSSKTIFVRNKYNELKSLCQKDMSSVILSS